MGVKFPDHSMLVTLTELSGMIAASRDYKHIREDIAEDKPPKYWRFWLPFIFFRNRLVFDYRGGEPDDIPIRFEKFDPVRPWTVMRFRSKVIFLFSNKNDLMRFRLQCEV